MKLVFACVIFFAVFAWSNIFAVWANISFEKGYLNIDTTKTCNVDTSYINCSLENGLSYYSTLDTNFAVFSQPRIAKIRVLAPSADSLAYSYSLSQVLRYEFLNWVEWGIIDLTKDSAQRLIDRILPENMVNRSLVYKKVCDDDLSLCPIPGPGGGSSGGISDEDAARLPQKKILAESAELVPADTSAKDSVGEQPKDSSASVSDSSGAAADTSEKPLQIIEPANFMAESVMQGMRYRVFDLNGVYLYDGTWQGSFKVQGKPVLVRFENGQTTVFR